MSDVDGTLEALRQAFDRVFTEPVAEAERGYEELIVVRVAKERVAMRLTELAGIERVERIVPLPGAPDALVGLAGLRGRLVPVFGLAGLLGLAAEPVSGWIAVVGKTDPVGLAFDELVGVETVAGHAVVASERQAALVPEAVRLGGGLMGVLDLTAVLAAVQAEEED